MYPQYCSYAPSGPSPTATKNDTLLVLCVDKVLLHSTHPDIYAELNKLSFRIIQAADAGVTLCLQYVNCAWKTRGDAVRQPMSSQVTEVATSFSFSVPYLNAVPEWEMPAVETLIGRVQETLENVTRLIMDWICEYRGIEADQDRGDLVVERLFASDDELGR
ncbi:hypothetical protein RUND412_009937 [Rhizina undulata]